MTATQTSVGRDGGGSSSRPAEHHDWLLEEMNRQAAAGIPNVDNAGHLTVIGELEYDGPVCAGGCGIAVEDDGGLCDTCAVSCPECGTDVSRPGLCFDCDVRASYVGGLAPRFGAEA